MPVKMVKRVINDMLKKAGYKPMNSLPQFGHEIMDCDVKTH